MNELQELEELLQELLSAIQVVMESGEVLSDEIQGELARTLELLSSRIDELRNPVEGLQPQVEAAPHASSNINAFQYDPKTKQLVVKFQDKYPLQNGPIYSYSNVPANIYDVFRRGAVAPKTSGKNAWHTWKKGVTPSHGASMYALIKQGGYDYRRLK